jgi:plastocyanin
VRAIANTLQAKRTSDQARLPAPLTRATMQAQNILITSVTCARVSRVLTASRTYGDHPCRPGPYSRNSGGDRRGWAGAAGYRADTAASEQQTVRVEMVTGSYEFLPKEVRIAPRTMVTRVNVLGSHATTSQSGVWDSVDPLNEGQTVSFTFPEPGEYASYCSPHQGRGMLGKVIVAPAAT